MLGASIYVPAAVNVIWVLETTLTPVPVKSVLNVTAVAAATLPVWSCVLDGCP
jgi:hypothetical protein